MNNCVVNEFVKISQHKYEYNQQNSFKIAQLLDSLNPDLKSTKIEKLMFIMHVKQQEEKQNIQQSEQSLPEFQNIFSLPKPVKKKSIQQDIEEPIERKSSTKKNINYGKRSQLKKQSNEDHNEVGDNELVNAWQLFESKRFQQRKKGLYKNNQTSYQKDNYQKSNDYNKKYQQRNPQNFQSSNSQYPKQKRPRVASSNILLRLKYDDNDCSEEDQNYSEQQENNYNYPQKKILKKQSNKQVSNTTNNAHYSLFKKKIKPNKKTNQPLSPLQEFAEKEGLDQNLVKQIEHEILLNKPDTKWEDIIGLKHVKDLIFETIIYPLKRPDIFKGLREPSKGILLFGPPGTGKTLIGKAIAGQLNATFFSISSSSLVSKWVGESERLIKTLFAIARFMQPSVIFVDEVDSMLSVRGDQEMDAVRRIKTEFFVQLDGAKTLDKDNVVVIGTTNRPEQIDEAARRRFVKRIYIPLPVAEARIDLIKNLVESEHQHGFKIQLNENELMLLEKMTEGYSCADIHQVMKEASMGPVRELIKQHGIEACEKWDKSQIRAVSIKDLKSALKRINKSVGIEEIERYESWNKVYGTCFN